MNKQKEVKGKPFLKWAGGKSQLLPTLASFLPKDLEIHKDFTYIEPFVGGGAMFFYMKQRFPHIKTIINDINLRLIKTYIYIRNHPDKLISRLETLEFYYRNLGDEESKKDFFLATRDRFNNSSLSDELLSAYMIFLNRTCFNGLYRENQKGKFNVPFGKYNNPKICDPELIINDSYLLRNTTILHGDYAETSKYVTKNSFFYFDPPYRPLNSTSSFTSYVKEVFNDNEQLRLKQYFEFLSNEGCFCLLSNSDCRGKDGNDTFFDNLYENFLIERILAKRTINANPRKRGHITELLIRNYKKTL